jgi:hypothetical protein
MGAIFTEGTNPQETVRNVNQILPGTPKPSRSVEMAIAQKPKKDIPALRQVPEAGVPILKSKHHHLELRPVHDLGISL